MKILDVELEFDFNDADDLEKLENAIEVTQKELAKINAKDEKTSVVVRQIGQAISGCFNSVFGEGTDIKIFGNKTNMKVCLKAFADLANARIQSEQELADELNSIDKKYGINRATRRAMK